jgi:NAD+ diphosphatase
MFVPAVVPPAALSHEPRFFVVHPKGLVVQDAPGGVLLPSASDVDALGLDRKEAHYLGRDGDVDCFAMASGDLASDAPFAVEGLRTLFGRLDEGVFAIAGRAMQVVAWADTHRFCGRCATPTERLVGERCLRCPKCALAVYPRISPAIIVLVRRGERALLARSSRFPLPFFSTLAGFVEPGESLEETLVREVREEVGISVKNVRYFGSQPWPFPNSLMVGFFAEHESGEIIVDGEEIAEARWFLESELPEVPPRISIARQLIEHWLAEVRA